jgi:uncharacterized protein YjbI with pentapeptide repeats
MANPEHFQILQQGVEAWKAWQRENRDITPDLARADLHSADLLGANLARANLIRAHLSEAKLNSANLACE